MASRYEVTTVESVYERYEVTARSADEAKRKVGDARQRAHMISMPVGSGGDVTIIEAREVGNEYSDWCCAECGEEMSIPRWRVHFPPCSKGHTRWVPKAEAATEVPG